MFTNESDCMHFYFAKYDHEIAIVVIDLVTEHIQKLAGNIPVYTTFDDIPNNVTSVAVVSQFPIDEALLPQKESMSYIFIGYKTFIIPPSESAVSLCVEDDESLQSVFEALCASEENTQVMNIDPLHPDLNGKRFHHIVDIPLEELDRFNFRDLEEIEDLWFHQRSIHTFESITNTGGRVGVLPNFFCYSGINIDKDQLHIIGVIEPKERLRSQFPSEGKFAGVNIGVRVGDITNESCDAIVNSANIYLQKGSGVCGAIFAAAGLQLKDACEVQAQKYGGKLRVGEAVITEGFNLKAKYIIHSVSPRCMFQWNDTIQKALYDAYNKIFEIAKREGFESIAIPAMGIGKHYCDLDRCIMIAMSVLDEYLYCPDKKLKRITFVLSDEDIANKYLSSLSNFPHFSTAKMGMDHNIEFEEKGKFHRALRYMLPQNSSFNTKQLKHILRIFDPELVDRITTRKECVRNLKYTGEHERLTSGKLYQSLTFNGSTYEIIDNTGAVMIIGSEYFEWVKQSGIEEV
jgi:O-acetyl-ADP-ribose deacetylase (regulator of RNase III)